MEERGKKGMDVNKCLGGRNDAGGKASILNAGSVLSVFELLAVSTVLHVISMQ